MTKALRIQFFHLLLSQTGKENRHDSRIQLLDLLFSETGQHRRYDDRVDLPNLFRLKVFRETREHERDCLIIQQRSCRSELRRKIPLLFFAQFIEHSRKKRSPLLQVLFFLSEDHELVQHCGKPRAALVLRYILKDLAQEDRHLLRIVHCGIYGLSCSEIDLNVIAGIQQHDVLDPRFLEFLRAVHDCQFDIELLEFEFFRCFLPFLYEIPGHDHGVPFAQKNIGSKFRSEDLVFRSLADRFGVSLEDFLMYLGLCEHFRRINLDKISDQAEIVFVGNRGSVLQRLDILLGDLNLQLDLLPPDLFLLKAEPCALRVITKQHVALADDLPFLHCDLLHFLRIREIDVLFSFRGDHARHTVLPVQIDSVIEV